MMRCSDVMMDFMRTTITIDDALLAEAKLIAAGTHRTLGAVVDDALRAWVSRPTASDAATTLPRSTPRRPGLNPGVDLVDRDALADLLDDSGRRALP
jgi:Arc/MetJ family transcription regulator